MILSWFRRRRRSTKLGYSFIDIHSGKPAYYWHDPKTDSVWMAVSRYSHFAVAKHDSVENIVKRLDRNPTAVLEVDYREYTHRNTQKEIA